MIRAVRRAVLQLFPAWRAALALIEEQDRLIQHHELCRVTPLLASASRRRRNELIRKVNV